MGKHDSYSRQYPVFIILQKDWGLRQVLVITALKDYPMMIS